MTDANTLDEISRKISDALPEGLGQLRDDVVKNVRATLSAALARMELVTREEFDNQTAVLARTREKLEALEAAVRDMEGKSATEGSADN